MEYLYLKLFFSLYDYGHTSRLIFFCNFNFLWCFRITFFPVSTSIYRKGLLMRSLQVSQHTDILQTQRRFYLFCYSTKFQHLHNTSYFQGLTQNTHTYTHRKTPLIFKHRTWTPFPASKPPRKILQSGVLLLTLLRRYREHGETLRFLGKGKHLGGQTRQEVFCLSNLDNIPHCNASSACFRSWRCLKNLLKCNKNPYRHVQKQSPSPNLLKDAITGLGKPGCSSPTKTIAILNFCGGMK